MSSRDSHILTLQRRGHARLVQLMDRYEHGEPTQRAAVHGEIEDLLTTHAFAEETVLLPADRYVPSPVSGRLRALLPGRRRKPATLDHPSSGGRRERRSGVAPGVGDQEPRRPRWTAMTTPAPATSVALTIGPIALWPPVVLAPMAGVTNPAFRRLCRRFGAGLYVSEMITARGLAEGADKTWERAAFDDDEDPRSIQLYGSDPVSMGEAVRRLVGDGHVDHVDLNLGCPARKITRHGGGSALTARPRLVAALIGAAVQAATAESGGRVPVTAKFRTGIDDERETFLDTGRIAEAEGAAAVALHARSAAQLYSGTADWSAIGRLKEAVTTIPVLGNGDIWSATDALRMVASTGCDGVVIGRGCLGRPWLFRGLVDAFEGRPPQAPPALGTVVDTLAEHLELLVVRMGEGRALRDIRKHVGWYLAGFPVGGQARRELTAASSLGEFGDALGRLDRSLALPPGAEALPRGTQRGPQKVTLPYGWLDDLDSAEPPSRLADAATSGG